MVVVLFAITAIAALLVALVNDMTKDAIAASQLAAKNAAKFSVVGTTPEEATIARDTTRTIGDFDITVSTVVRAEDNSLIGYADRITLMVGFVKEGNDVIVSSVEVLSQKETPGLGANMMNEGNSLERSVVGKVAAELIFAVTKEGGSFDALTGSTISSRAYANAVETAYAGYLWATGALDTSEEAIEEAMEDAPTGASMTNDWEPEAQEGDMSNE